MVTMYNKDGKAISVMLDQIEIMKAAGYTFEKPELMPDVPKAKASK